MERGQVLRDRYVIEARLKAGGMSSVYLARDRNLGDSLCAVKQMVEALDEPADSRRRFEAEMRALVSLRHPRIPRVRDFFSESTGHFLIMDYVEGQSLEEELAQRGQPFSEREVVRDALDVLEVLEYLHSLQPAILHRDIKPANLIRERRSGRIVVVDFGLAREAQASARHSSVGTLGYSSVEQIQGHTQPASDIFSLGITMHVLLTGQPPIFGQTPSWPNQFDPQLVSILRKACEPEVKDRYSRAREMRKELTHWLEPKFEYEPQMHGVFRSPHFPLSSEHLYGRRRRILTLSILFLLLILGWAWKGRPSHPALAPQVKGDLFGCTPSEEMGCTITLGESVGLLRVVEWQKENANQRGERVKSRLNRLYHDVCPTCGNRKLEPQGIMAGRYRQGDINEVVVFYNHRHGEQLVGDALLIATVDHRMAQLHGSRPDFLAAYWRELLRDVVRLSRGETPTTSKLGQELALPLEKAREQQLPGALRQNLSVILSKLNNSQAQRLQNAFGEVPGDFEYSKDNFDPWGFYSPLAQ